MSRGEGIEGCRREGGLRKRRGMDVEARSEADGLGRR